MTEVPLTTTEISEQVKRRAKPVNQGYSLDAYFAVADSTGVTVRQRAPHSPPFSDPTTTAPGDLEPRPHPAHHIPPRTSHPNSTQAKIYRDEGNQQELFRVLMAFCTLVVETMGKHRDHAGNKHKARYRAYLAEVKACMEEMEAIKPGINAEAKMYRERMHAEEPKARPPPVAGAGTAASGVASSITRPDGLRLNSDAPSTSGTMSNGGTIDDLLSASPEKLAAAAAASLGTLGTLTLADDDTAVRQSQNEDGLHRYRPKSEFAAAATSTSTARHSLLGTSLPPQPKPQTRIPQIRDVTPITTSSQAGNYPNVRSTKTAVPEMRANLSMPPPPPQGPPPQTPSAPPMPMPMPRGVTNTGVTGVSVPRGQPPPPPGPPPSGVPTGNYGLSAASRFVYFSTLVVYAGD
jgi:hypothetical protein